MILKHLEKNCHSFFFQFNTNEFICIAAMTIILTLLVEMPCNNLKSLLLDRVKSTRKDNEVDINANVKAKEL